MTAPDVPHAPPPLDALLARRDWVRRFARTLARDDAAADDLAQDTWLDAIERPPVHAAKPAGWLRRALTWRARDAARAARRRDAHEHAAARPELAGADGSVVRGAAARDVGDVVAAAEMHRRVVDAVVALDEPYRTTVLLRFFEDLPPREVAARMGVPVETVRARTRRAVERLRERFDARHGGERAAWIAPLLGAAGGETSCPDAATRARPAARSGDAPVPTGGSSVARTLRTAGFAAAAVAAGWAAIVALAPDDGAVVGVAAAGDDAPPAGGAAAPRAPHPRAERPAGDTAGDDAPVPAGPESAGKVPARPVERDFVVTVVDPGGAPVRGTRVRIDPALAPEEPVGTTGADGTIVFRVAGPVRTAEVLPNGADGRAWRFRRDETAVVPGADRCTLTAEPGAWIRGTVRSEHAAIAAGAEVVALDRGFAVGRTIADASGRFEIAVPPASPVDLALTGHRREPWREVRINTPGGRHVRGVEYWGSVDGNALAVAPGTDGVTIDARVPADGGASLRIRVVGADGSPVAGVPVHADRGLLLSQEIRPAVPTDAEGRALLGDLPHRRVKVMVRTWDTTSRPWEALGWAVPREAPFVRPDAGELTLVMPRGRRIHGVVEVPDAYFPVSPDGKPDRSALGDGPFLSVRTVDGATVASARAESSGTFSFLADLRDGERFVVTAGAVSMHGVEWSARTPVTTSAAATATEPIRLCLAAVDESRIPLVEEPAAGSPDGDAPSMSPPLLEAPPAAAPK